MDPMAMDESEQLVLKFREYLSIAWKGKYYLILFMLLTGLAAFVLSKFQTPIYEAKATVSIDVRPPEIVRSQIYTGPNWFEINYYISEQVRVLTSRRLAERVVESLHLDTQGPFAGANDPAAAFARGVDIDHEEESNILNISLRGKDPEQVTLWVNQLVEKYSEINILDSIDKSKKIREVIQNQLDPLREQLSKSEANLTLFKEEKNYYWADEDKNVISEQINKLNEEYATAKVERINLESKIKALKDLRAGKISMQSFPEILDNASIQQLNSQRVTLEVEKTKLMKTYKPEHPKVVALDNQIREINASISREIGLIVSGLETQFSMKKQREESLLANVQNLKEEAIDLSKSRLAYDKLRQEYEQNKSFYEDMLTRSKELDISSTVNLNRVRVIDPAIVPTVPIKPNIRRNTLMGLVLGLLLGFAFLFGMDYLDSSIKTPDDVEKYLGIPVLSVIPSFSPDKVKILREFYQSIRTGVIFTKRSEGCQVLMVTSGGPGEGKSTTSFNLAKIFAAAGDKVLLMDCDFRRPALHKHLKISNSVGITSHLFGSKDQEIIRTSEIPNLWVATSGPLPPNPPELITRNSFKMLIQSLKSHFNWIIIDSPPLVSVTDSLLLSTYTDMVILVIRYNDLDRRIIKQCLKGLQHSGANIAGSVINDVDLDQDTRYSHHYYYYYYKGYDNETPKQEERGARIKKKRMKA